MKAHILLVAQRRMGKTSLMREVKRRLGSQYHSLFVDLQKASSPQDAIVELCLAMKPYQTLWGKAKDLFSNALNTLSGSIEESDSHCTFGQYRIRADSQAGRP
jgi:AAA+ ATPase superfamily predicted ATPase